LIYIVLQFITNTKLEKNGASCCNSLFYLKTPLVKVMIVS
jgi:hypothetical protein